MIETFLGLTFAGLALLGVKIGVVVLLAALTVFFVAVGNGATACRRFSLVWGGWKINGAARWSGVEKNKTGGRQWKLR